MNPSYSNLKNDKDCKEIGMNSVAFRNFNLVKNAVYMYGTLSPTEIQNILKSAGHKMSRPAIHRHLQKLKESNYTWISDQAKAGYLETVRTIVQDKKQRLRDLKQERDSIDQPTRTKAYYGEVITNTENSLKEWMEGLPLLMQFNSLMNNENQDTIEIEENTTNPNV